jgi:hypothetical protein
MSLEIPFLVTLPEGESLQDELSKLRLFVLAALASSELLQKPVSLVFQFQRQ